MQYGPVTHTRGGGAGFRPLPAQVLRFFSAPRFGIYVMAADRCCFHLPEREGKREREREREEERERETSKDAALQCLTPATVQILLWYKALSLHVHSALRKTVLRSLNYKLWLNT